MTRHLKTIVEDVGMELGDKNQQTIKQQLSMNLKEFADKVSAFNKLGESLYGGGNFSEIAEQLEEISNHAEAYTLRETDGAWFDQVTIKRNMKELKGYAGDFKKVATDARALKERMTALYEDCGKVLGRYFEIKEYGQADGMTTEPQKSENELQINARAGIREESHAEFVKTHKPPQPCTAHDVTFGGKCMNCGYKGDGREHKLKPWKQAGATRDSVKEGGPGSGVKGHKQEKSAPERSTRPVHSAKFGVTIPPGAKITTIDGLTVVQHPEHKNLFLPYKPYETSGGKSKTNESIKLSRLLEDINDDYPKEDWVKLDVPMLKYDVAKEFEKDLKKKGFTIKRFDWKERAAQGEEFSEFWVRKEDFDEANAYAVKAYQAYDNNARMGEE
jgi:hypothetical protein